jgi:hypothetical protein
MKLMLVFLLGMVILGLATDRLDRRTYSLIIGAAVMTTGTYFFLERFMT